MAKMLRALGIDYSAYLHQVPVNKIKDSAGKCETCPTTGICDEKLEQGSLTSEEIDFCPNQECLTRFKEIEKPTTGG